jgi:uncharacterized coiled-coil protein SlyX
MEKEALQSALQDVTSKLNDVQRELEQVKTRLTQLEQRAFQEKVIEKLDHLQRIYSSLLDK